jgi:hypothetical protein
MRVDYNECVKEIHRLLYLLFRVRHPCQACPPSDGHLWRDVDHVTLVPHLGPLFLCVDSPLPTNTCIPYIKEIFVLLVTLSPLLGYRPDNPGLSFSQSVLSVAWYLNLPG